MNDKLIIACSFLIKESNPDSFNRKTLTGEQRKCLLRIKENRMKLISNLLLLANLATEKALDIEKTDQQTKQTKT